MVSVLLVLGATLLALPARAEVSAEGFASECLSAAPAEAIQDTFQRIMALPRDEGCALVGVSTEHFRTEVHYTLDGKKVAPLKLAPTGCVTNPELEGKDFALGNTAALAEACPEVLAGIRKIVGERTIGARTERDPHSRASDLAAWTSRGLLAATALLSFLLVWRARKRERPPLRWLLTAGSGFVVALAVRWTVEPNLANWYTEVLPHQGDLFGRFGPGAYVFQSALRTVLPWTDSTMFLANAVLGALAAPLLVAIIAMRKGSVFVAAVAATLVAFAPLHVRVSASASAHVLASTYVLGALVSWTVATRSRDWTYGALAIVLAASATLTRADQWPGLLAIPIWGLLLDRVERRPREKTSARWIPAAVFVAGWVGVGACAYYGVVVPSKHPMPAAESHHIAGLTVITQYWSTSSVPPYWFSPVAVPLAAMGVVACAIRRPMLLVSAVFFLALAFIPLGRNLNHDEMIGARYFLATIPVFMIISGFGAEICLSGLKRALAELRGSELGARGEKLLATWALSTVAIATIVPAVGAYRTTYTFQDEYRFLREELGKLPDGCVLYQLPIRQSAFERDLDCCLDVPRTPLGIAYPKLKLEMLDEGPPFFPSALPECAAYYESAACSLADNEVVRERHLTALRTFRRQCNDVFGEVHAELLGETRASNHSLNHQFDGVEVPVRLHRVEAKKSNADEGSRK